MALGNRNQNNIDSVPQEVQEYYQSERRERSGVAWLLALGTLVITLLLAVGLFFGGRWLWQKISNDDPDPVVTSQTDTSAPAATDDNATDDGTASDDGATDGTSGTDSSDAATEETTDNDNTSTDGGAQTDGQDAGTPTPSGEGDRAESDQSSEGKLDESDELADTGPTETAAVFFGAVIVGMIGYRLVWLRDSSRKNS